MRLDIVSNFKIALAQNCFLPSIYCCLEALEELLCLSYRDGSSHFGFLRAPDLHKSRMRCSVVKAHKAIA